MSSISKQLSSIGCAGRKAPRSSPEIRLVMLGKTGSGKSSTANTILGRRVFDTKASSSPVTRRSTRARGEFRGQNLTVLDTPGLLDTLQGAQEVQRELGKTITLLYPGPHVFLLVVRIARFTEEDKEALRQIRQAMGSSALSFSVVVFTHGDCLEEGVSVKQCMMEQCEDLAELVAACGGRHCVFNNRSSKSKEQVTELLALVDVIMEANEGNCYTNKLLQRAEEDLALELQEEAKTARQKEEQAKTEQEAEIKEWYERELEMIRQRSGRELEMLKKQQELEKEEEDRLARNREEAFRRMMEEYDQREKERTVQEMVRVMELHREEQEKREALQKNHQVVTATLQEEVDREKKMRKDVEERMQKERAEREKREREREAQQIQKETAIRQREEMRREALHKELERLTESLEDKSRKEEDRQKQMEDLLRRMRDENERERDIQMENQRAEKRKNLALKQELKLVRLKMEQQETREEDLRRQLDECRQCQEAKRNGGTSAPKKQCDKMCSKHGDGSRRRAATATATAAAAAAEGGVLANVTGYAQEMGLVGLNAALETVGAPCCIQ